MSETLTESDLHWSPQQQAALAEVEAWLRDPLGPQVYRLQGYAGTGKTTIAVDVYRKHDALACAFTGKAASVMANKGLFNATTLHRLIYDPMGNDDSHLKELQAELELLEKVPSPQRSTLQRLEAVRRAVEEAAAKAGRPRFVLKEQSAISRAGLVILDEGSMIDERMGEDLLSFGTKVLVLGDPAQLPPIRGEGFFLGDQLGKWSTAHTTTLTEIHRQARGNPIIAMATDVRRGRALQLGNYGAAQVVERIGAAEALAADQVLCGTNAKRWAINARHRELGEHSGHPMPRAGEKLVCLKNNHDLGILNGTQWRNLEDVDWEPGDDAVALRIEGWDFPGAEIGLPAEPAIFLDESQKIDLWSINEWFTWGYCMTVHKSQGSQWDSVVLFDDWSNRATHQKWLYTGVTRAAKRLTVVL